MATKPRKTKPTTAARSVPGKASAQPKLAKTAAKFRLDQEPLDAAHRFETGTTPVAAPGAGSLPAAYGSGVVYLVAKDPSWLFCYWDIDWSKHRGPSDTTPPLLRLIAENGTVAVETEVNPHARNWYLPSPAQGVTFTAQVGYATADGWRLLAASEPAFVPAMDFSGDESVEFATLPVDVGFDRLLGSVRDATQAGESLMNTLARLQRSASATPATAWSDTQRRVLDAILGEEMVDRISMGSAEIEKMLRRRLDEHLGSGVVGGFSSGALAAPLEVPGSGSLFGGFSSGASWGTAPGGAPGREFLMHVNAEVIFYGGTHPDATVWINGKEITLQPDGSFRYHFIFPDGAYEIPIVARSPDGVETRSARLNFRRDTAREGTVGNTAQPALEQPMGRTA